MKDVELISISSIINEAKRLTNKPVIDEVAFDKLINKLKEQVRIINRINDDVLENRLLTTDHSSPNYKIYKDIKREKEEYIKNESIINDIINKDYDAIKASKVNKRIKGKKIKLNKKVVAGIVAFALVTFGIATIVSKKNNNVTDNNPKVTNNTEDSTENTTEKTNNKPKNNSSNVYVITRRPNTEITEEVTTENVNEDISSETENTTVEENTQSTTTEDTTEKTTQTTTTEDTTEKSTQTTTTEDITEETTQTTTTENTTEETTQTTTTEDTTEETTENTETTEYDDESQDNVLGIFRTMKEDIIELYSSNEAKLAKEKAKEYVVSTIDFLFFNASINGMTFKDLRSDVKEELYEILQGMDAVVSYFDPDYKEELGEKYNSVKNFADEKYDLAKEKIIEKIGQEKYDEIINEKNEIFDKIVETFKKYGGKALRYIKDKYDIWKNKTR